MDGRAQQGGNENRSHGCCRDVLTSPTNGSNCSDCRNEQKGDRDRRKDPAFHEALEPIVVRMVPPPADLFGLMKSEDFFKRSES